MPRQARRKSESGIYHIMLRGINHQQIFEDEEDRQRFIETLIRYQKECGYIIYAYCLMGNHIHLLLKEEKEELALILKKIAGSYAYWYNWKYHRCGHLFQDRFKSEPVETDEYFLTVIRYIHQNPVKSGICRKAKNYKYSSMKEYINKPIIVDSSLAFSIITKKEFIDFHDEETTDNCLEIESHYRLSDNEAKQIIAKITKCKNITELQTLDKATRNRYIKKLYASSLSIRQISRLTGISKKVVENNAK